MSLLSDAGPFTAVSRADGTILIEPAWHGYRPRDCKEVVAPAQDCPRCQIPHLGGVYSRLTLAKDIERLLNATRRSRRKVAR